METVYVETSVPSLLVARPSQNIVTAARQIITQEWWNSAPGRFELLISELVLDEMAQGEWEMAQRRLAAVEGLRSLPMTADVGQLVSVYQARLGLGSNAMVDIFHIAMAVTHQIDYLVTWNLRHLANAVVIRRLQRLNEELGVWTPLIVTPQELGPETEEGDE